MVRAPRRGDLVRLVLLTILNAICPAGLSLAQTSSETPSAALDEEPPIEVKLAAHGIEIHGELTADLPLLP